MTHAARLSIFALFSFYLVSCDPPIVSKDELTKYLEDESNGTIKLIEDGDFKISATYYPTDLIVLQTVDGSATSSHQVDSIRDYYKPFTYFTVNISRAGREAVESYGLDQAKFASALNYVSFEIGRDMQLVQGGDTTAVEDFVYNRSYGAGNASSMLVAFKTNARDHKGDPTLELRDSFFGTGLSRFEFRRSDLKKVPTLKF